MELSASGVLWLRGDTFPDGVSSSWLSVQAPGGSTSDSATGANPDSLLTPTPVRGGGLPAQPGPLVGRSAEVRWIRERPSSDATRLLTLHGAGGTGKTRLAIEVAGEVASAFPDGVYVVDLSPLRYEALLASAPRQATERGGMPCNYPGSAPRERSDHRTESQPSR